MRRYSARDYSDDYDDGYRHKAQRRPSASYNKNPSLPQARSAYNDDDEYDREVKVSRDFDPIGRRTRSTGDDDFNFHRQRSVTSPIQKRQPDHVIVTDLTKIDIRSLFIGAPPRSVRQTIDVERLEDELLYSLPPGHHPGWTRPRRYSSTGDNDTNSPVDEFEKVDEQMEMDVKDGMAITISRVRSEKIVPILGSDEMFKKSSLLVTRRVEVDLMATPTRRSLYELILDKQKDAGLFDTFSSWRYRNSESGGLSGLTKRENGELYRVFMGLAELYKMI